MKRIAIFAATVMFLQLHADCSILKKIVITQAKDSAKLTLTIDNPVAYKVNKTNNKAVITFPSLKFISTGPASIQTRILGDLKIEDKNGTCEITANFKYLTSSKVTFLKDPNRIIIDFRKLSQMQVPKFDVPEIIKIYTKSLPDKFKISIYLTSFVPYNIISSESGLMIELPNTNCIIKSRKMVTKDKLIPKIGIDQMGKSTLISISQNYPAFYQIYKVDDPAQLVIEFDKASKSTIAAKDLTGGMRLIKIVKGTEEGPVTVNALLVDQNILNVAPYLAVKKEEAPNMIGSIGQVFTFWMPKDQAQYSREKVSDMVADSGALAGVNGAFFGDYGEPLGVLMINGELISYSIHDRTALIIDRTNHCYIDNVSLAGEASIEGVTVQISGINNKRQLGEAVIYMPRYGNETKEESPGIILSITGNEVKNISRARGWIPKDGYALSLDSTYYESLGGKVRIGSKIDTSLKLIALSGIQNLEIKHVIGGGPRLLKSGQVYISKNGERFKSDVAKSRASRTAVGISKDGTLVFATVDKCKQTPSASRSAGATLEELAQIMKELGCVDAMNLDGGSSSAMVVNSNIINEPSSSAEIAVSNGILISK